MRNTLNLPPQTFLPVPFLLQVNEHITIRQRDVKDAEEMFALTHANRSYLRRWLPWLDAVHSMSDTRTVIEQSLREAACGKGFSAAIICDQHIVGVIGYNSIHHANRVGQIGYWLDQSHQGQGIMTTACRAFVDHGFRVMNLNRQVISSAVDNAASRRIPERLGFSMEGIAREAEWLYDHFVDHAIYAMLRHEWKG